MFAMAVKSAGLGDALGDWGCVEGSASGDVDGEARGDAPGDTNGAEDVIDDAKVTFL